MVYVCVWVYLDCGSRRRGKNPRLRVLRSGGEGSRYIPGRGQGRFK